MRLFKKRCNHKWKYYERFKVTGWNEYYILLFRCEECGNLKKVKIGG